MSVIRTGRSKCTQLRCTGLFFNEKFRAIIKWCDMNHKVPRFTAALIQSKPTVMSASSNLAAGFLPQERKGVCPPWYLTMVCPFCRPAAVPGLHLHPGRVCSGGAYPAGGFACSHMLLHEEETQVHPGAFRWVGNAVTSLCLILERIVFVQAGVDMALE